MSDVVLQQREYALKIIMSQRRTAAAATVDFKFKSSSPRSDIPAVWTEIFLFKTKIHFFFSLCAQNLNNLWRTTFPFPTVSTSATNTQMARRVYIYKIIFNIIFYIGFRSDIVRCNGHGYAYTCYTQV